MAAEPSTIPANYVKTDLLGFLLQTIVARYRRLSADKHYECPSSDRAKAIIPRPLWIASGRSGVGRNA